MTKLTADQEPEAIEAYRLGNMRAATALVETHEGRIRRAVRPAASFGVVPEEDLLQVGRMALLEATGDWVEGRLWRVAARAVVRAAFEEVARSVGVSEATFRRIANAVRESHGDREAARAYASAPERGSQRVAPETFDAVHEALGEADEVDTSEGPPAPSTAPDAETLRLMEAVSAAAHVLDDRERLVLVHHFGLGVEPERDADIGRRLRVDRSRVVRIRARAVEKLREEISVSA